MKFPLLIIIAGIIAQPRLSAVARGSQPSLLGSRQIRLGRISEPYSTPPARFQRGRKGWLDYGAPSSVEAATVPPFHQHGRREETRPGPASLLPLNRFAAAGHRCRAAGLPERARWYKTRTDERETRARNYHEWGIYLSPALVADEGEGASRKEEETQPWEKERIALLAGKPFCG